MKKTVIVFESNDPILVRKFERWLKNRYNVFYPNAEKRFDGIRQVRYEVGYRAESWLFPSSERSLELIAQGAVKNHCMHVSYTEELYVDWCIFND